MIKNKFSSKMYREGFADALNLVIKIISRNPVILGHEIAKFLHEHFTEKKCLHIGQEAQAKDKTRINKSRILFQESER